MSEHATTANGYEIAEPIDKMTATEYRTILASEYGINGATPSERLTQLKQLSNEGVAILFEHINRGVQGSGTSLMNEGTTLIGQTATIRPEHRYQVFTETLDAIRHTPDAVNPARVADVVALGVVLLHPFLDGNGRTARIIGLTFRDYFDGDEYKISYDMVAKSRDVRREQGGYMLNGYIPTFPEGFDQSDPEQVNGYLKTLLREEGPGAYTSCFGQAPLYEV